MTDMPEFKYNGAKVLTILHEQEMRKFVDTWKKAKAASVTLPAVRNPDYDSFDQLLHHVVFRALDNMLWICDSLGLPEPDIKPIPEGAELENTIDEYLDYLLGEFRKPLTGVRGKDFYFKTYTSKWNTQYCIDAMMEHLVLHATRHTFQLEQLL